MRIPVLFEIKDYIYTKHEDKNYYLQCQYKNKIVNIKFDAGLYALANSQTKHSQKLTRESLQAACEGALRAKSNFGLFEIYLDKGVFDLAD